MSDGQRKIPFTLSTQDYLAGLEWKISQVLSNNLLPPRADTELAAIADELRRAVWRLRQRDLWLLKKGLHPCQLQNRSNTNSR